MLSKQLREAPLSPGVYQFFDAQGSLLYVGKAKVLRHRLKSYFRFSDPPSPAPNLSLRITKMVSQVTSLQTLIVPSEHDALILENSLIKQLKPKYNILLRDDKTYPYIAIDLQEPFPRFEITRKVVQSKSMRYFGPYATSARELLQGLYLCFGLVQKKGCLKSKKACLFHQIKRCHAPCEGKISSKAYSAIVQEALEALRTPSLLIERLTQKMHEAAEKLNFEEASHLRDTIASIGNTIHTTHVELLELGNYDLFAIVREGERAVIMRLFVREGKIVSTSHTTYYHTQGFDTDELYARALFEFYHAMEHTLADEILVAHTFEEKQSLETFLTERFGRRVPIKIPQKGPKKALITVALDNANRLLSESFSHTKDALLLRIQSLCNLENLPKRIEVFDNSHLFGTHTVGGMVVWEEGFVRSAYRRYHLHVSDEYGQMREMLSRRIGDFHHEPPPDLWLLDGGDTLQALAQTLLKEAGIRLEVIAIAKEKRDAKAHRAKGKAHDTLYTNIGALHLATSDARLHFLQKLRDEAHRFAITYHRSKKRSNDLTLPLMHLPGIGEARVKKLLNFFGSFEALQHASLETLEGVIGKPIAATLHAFLNESSLQ